MTGRDILNSTILETYVMNSIRANMVLHPFDNTPYVGVEELLNREYYHVADFIDAAFYWDNTPEGEDYWCDIHDRMIHIYKLPKTILPKKYIKELSL